MKVFENKFKIITQEGLFTYEYSKLSKQTAQVDHWFTDEGRMVDCAVRLSDIAKIASRKAFSSKGKNKGQLLKKCPAGDTPQAAVWIALMINANIHKVSPFGALLLSQANKDIYEEVINYIDVCKIDCTWMDTDGKALRYLCAW